MTKSKVEIVAHSRGPNGDELISVLCTFPRIVLAEVNTHRMLSKNTSSSRAIPFFSMVKAVTENSFIPYAFQKHHKGMQGTEYLDPDKKFTWEEISGIIFEQFEKHFNEEKDENLEVMNVFLDYVQPLFYQGDVEGKTPTEWWLKTRDIVVGCAILLYSMGVTKQIANRLLEPFMWVTMLITGNKSSWENFFKLRAPMYTYSYNMTDKEEYSKSWKDYVKIGEDLVGLQEAEEARNASYIERQHVNKSQAEIHIQDLAENIWDKINESTPKDLKAGEWHIPFEDKLRELNVSNDLSGKYYDKGFEPHLASKDLLIKSSTAMAARTSYTVVGIETELTFESLLDVYETKLIGQEPPHSSPFEHCARVMIVEDDEEEAVDNEYYHFIKGNDLGQAPEYGWCNNFKGFIQLRYFIDNNIKPF